MEIKLDFLKIDNPIEFYLSPPNDGILGLCMDIVKVDKFHFKGSIDDNKIDYIYNRDSNGEIAIEGIFSGEEIKEKGIIIQTNQGINIEGKIGESKIESKIRSAPNGPEIYSTIDNKYEFFEKINFDLIKNNIKISGRSGEVAFLEKIESSSSDSFETIGYIGDDTIKRKIEFVKQKGFHISGNIGTSILDEWILF